MKNIRLLSFVLTLCAVSFSLMGADEIIVLPKVFFDLKTPNASAKLQEVLLNPENALKRYQPAGAKITQKSVGNRQIQFLATKSVLLLSKTILVHGYFEVISDHVCSSPSEEGYVAHMDFAGSDDMLTDNVEKYEAVICVSEKSSSDLHLQVDVKIYRGNKYSDIFGPIVTDMITAQTTPLFQAISEEVLAQ